MLADLNMNTITVTTCESRKNCCFFLHPTHRTRIPRGLPHILRGVEAMKVLGLLGDWMAGTCRKIDLYRDTDSIFQCS